jgi:hypothetical protein
VKRTGNLLYIGSKDSEQLVVNTTALSEEIMKGASEQEKSKSRISMVYLYSSHLFNFSSTKNA